VKYKFDKFLFLESIRKHGKRVTNQRNVHTKSNLTVSMLHFNQGQKYPFIHVAEYAFRYMYISSINLNDIY